MGFELWTVNELRTMQYELWAYGFRVMMTNGLMGYGLRVKEVMVFAFMAYMLSAMSKWFNEFKGL